MDANLRARAEQWAANDPDPLTREELRALLASGDLSTTDLADRFSGPLEFGTAGLRGVLGAGENRMNRAVVLRTTWGLARYLKESVPGVASRGVVIGCDGRRMSREFAEDAAGVLAAEGIRVALFSDLAPTPLAAFAVKLRGACAGIMVTASHNPPEYNGYKVYWGNGAQIVPPVDTGIAAQIARAPAALHVPRLELAEARARGLLEDIGEPVVRAYLDAVLGLQDRSRGDRALSIVYTPLHGVGAKLVKRALAEAGFSRVSVVPQQEEPDGAFPTVAFPNPEEKGAMDLALGLAKRQRADLILANDPDADRLAVAVPCAPGEYVQLTGNQVGVLLGHYLLTERKIPDRALVIASIVSSPMLGVIARKLGVRYEETLTGFKWIANRAMDLAREGYAFVFGYEEALGYTVGDVVRDKDGISAAVVFAEVCAHLRARGESVLARLEAISREFGLFVSSQLNITKKGADGASEIRALMAALRASAPTRVGEYEVVGACDYEAQVRRGSDGSRSPVNLPASNVLAFELSDGSRIIARPSGTEPKIKFYFDVREDVRAEETLENAEARAAAKMHALADAWRAIFGAAGG